MNIKIVDENEAPLFNGAPYSDRVTENWRFSKKLKDVHAVDNDFGGQTLK